MPSSQQPLLPELDGYDIIHRCTVCYGNIGLHKQVKVLVVYSNNDEYEQMEVIKTVHVWALMNFCSDR